MSKFLRQQAAPDIDINVFIGNLVYCYCFFAVFRDLVEKKIDDPWGRLTKLIKYTDNQIKQMIKHCI